MRDGVRLLALAVRHWCSRPGLLDADGVDRPVVEAARQTLFCWAVHARPCAVVSGRGGVPVSDSSEHQAAKVGGSSTA